MIHRTHFASIMTWKDWEIIAETGSYIFRWRSRCFRRHLCLSSLKCGHVTSLVQEGKQKKKKIAVTKTQTPEKLRPSGCISRKLRPCHSTYSRQQVYTTEAIPDYVDDVLPSFWPLLWFVTEQTHGNMESTSFRSKRDKSYQILFISVESDSRGCFARFWSKWTFASPSGFECFGALSFQYTWWVWVFWSCEFSRH